MSVRIFSFRIALVLAAAMTADGCAHRTPNAGEANHWQQARQLVLVIIDDWDADHGIQRRYERQHDGWREIGNPQPVMVGGAGAAWGLGLHAPGHAGPIKREGDGRSPAGVFTIGPAFGYGPSAATALPYLPMQATNYCVDVSGSPLYNRIVDAQVVGSAAVAQATEPMRRDVHADGDQRYRLGFVIEHNVPAQAMAGSCIFAHLWKSPGVATSGCTAMDPATMDEVLAWLRPEDHPVFVLLPKREYQLLQRAWRLPHVVDVR